MTNRCPNGQRRIEGKCVYKTLYNDCKYIARRYRNGQPLKPMMDELLETYALDKETAKERFKYMDRQIKKGYRIRWDDCYYVALGAGGEGW